jgi:hypothetical protein
MKYDRREFLKLGAAAAATTLIPSIAFAAEAQPRRLSAGEHLFIDDYWIAQQSNVRRAIQTPARLPEPIVRSESDKCFQPYMTILRDPQSQRFRLWYNTTVSSSQSHIGYMESPDGVEFVRPYRELADPPGLKVGMGASVIDDGPGFADPSRRFKLAFEENGLFTCFSPDGLTWTPSSPTKVLGDIGDIVSLSWDPFRKRYLLICKKQSEESDGYKGSTPNAKEGTRRCVGQSFSDDCIHWTPAQHIIKPDDRDEGITEFYSVGKVIARDGLLIGMLKVLRDDLAHEEGEEKRGIGYTVLAWTRDGRTWQRDREPFLPRNPTPGTWDRAMTWGDCFTPVGDEVFCYYGGYARGHKVERFKERQIGLARMKRDRFVARVAEGGEGGTLRTPPVTLDGSKLTLNADVAGEIRVALLDADGKPLAGLASSDCTPVKGDSLSHEVQWKQPLSDLRTKPVQIEFVLKDAKLYGFEVVS